MNCKYICNPITRDGFMVWFEFDTKTRKCVLCSDVQERYGLDAEIVVSDTFRLQFENINKKYYGVMINPNILEAIMMEFDNVLTLEHVWAINRRTGKVLTGHDVDNLQLVVTPIPPKFNFCPSAR